MNTILILAAAGVLVLLGYILGRRKPARAAQADIAALCDALSRVNLKFAAARCASRAQGDGLTQTTRQALGEILRLPADNAHSEAEILADLTQKALVQKANLETLQARLGTSEESLAEVFRRNETLMKALAYVDPQRFGAAVERYFASETPGMTERAEIDTMAEGLAALLDDMRQ